MLAAFPSGADDLGRRDADGLRGSGGLTGVGALAERQQQTSYSIISSARVATRLLIAMRKAA